MDVPGCFSTVTGRLERRSFKCVPTGSLRLTWREDGREWEPRVAYLPVESDEGPVCEALEVLASNKDRASGLLLLFRDGRGDGNPFCVGGSWSCKAAGRTVVFYVKRDPTGGDLLFCANVC
jgi:hypothetical protein